MATQAQLNEVEVLVTENYGFSPHLKYNFVHTWWVEEFLKSNSPEEAARLYAERCYAVQRSVLNEFAENHKAMTNAGAESYAKNWN